MNEEIKRKLLECIDEGLNSLGRTVKQVIYWYLENKFGVKRCDILDKPEEFIRALELMYGCGVVVLENMIVSKIREEFNVQSEDFIGAIMEIKRRYDSFSKIQNYFIILIV